MNGGENSKRSLQPSSSPLSASSVPIQDATYLASQDTTAMLASNKAKKVIQWFRSTGRESPIEEPIPKTKYRKGNTTNHSGSLTAPGLAESDMSPQVVVSPPHSAPPEEPFNSKDGEPPWDPVRNTLMVRDFPSHYLIMLISPPELRSTRK